MLINTHSNEVQTLVINIMLQLVSFLFLTEKLNPELRTPVTKHSIYFTFACCSKMK